MLLDRVDQTTETLVVTPAQRASLLEIAVPLRRDLAADYVMISYVSRRHHHVAAAEGFKVPQETGGRLPLDYSICLHAVAMDFPLIVEDAHRHPLVRGNRTVDEMGVAAYLGAPIRMPDVGAVGTTCVMHLRPRRWSEADLARVKRAAQQIDALLDIWTSQREPGA